MKYRSSIQLTEKQMREALNLVSGLEITHIEKSPAKETYEIFFQSEEEIEEITFPTHEAAIPTRLDKFPSKDKEFFV